MVGRSIVGLEQKAPQRLRVQDLAVGDSNTRAARIVEGRSLEAVGMDMVGMAARGLPFLVYVGEECHVGWGAKDAENGDTDLGRFGS